MFNDIPHEQLRLALQQVAGDILSEAGLFEPPVDAFELAARLGLAVARDGADAETRARFVQLGGASATGQGAILLAEEPRPERRHWAVAHEIGEHQAFRLFEELGVDPLDAPGARESVANRLAGCLLLPHEWFAADGPDLDWDLFELKSRYATASHELIARHMLEMGPPVIITLWDNGQPQWRRWNISGRVPPLSDPELAARQAAHACGQPTRCETSELPSELADVRAWPVHEPGWKREITRAELSIFE